MNFEAMHPGYNLLLPPHTGQDAIRVRCSISSCWRLVRNPKKSQSTIFPIFHDFLSIFYCCKFNEDTSLYHLSNLYSLKCKPFDKHRNSLFRFFRFFDFFSLFFMVIIKSSCKIHSRYTVYWNNNIRLPWLPELWLVKRHHQYETSMNQSLHSLASRLTTWAKLAQWLVHTDNVLTTSLNLSEHE